MGQAAVNCDITMVTVIGLTRFSPVHNSNTFQDNFYKYTLYSIDLIQFHSE